MAIELKAWEAQTIAIAANGCQVSESKYLIGSSMGDSGTRFIQRVKVMVSVADAAAKRKGLFEKSQQRARRSSEMRQDKREC